MTALSRSCSSFTRQATDCPSQFLTLAISLSPSPPPFHSSSFSFSLSLSLQQVTAGGGRGGGSSPRWNHGPGRARGAVRGVRDPAQGQVRHRQRATQVSEAPAAGGNGRGGRGRADAGEGRVKQRVNSLVGCGYGYVAVVWAGSHPLPCVRCGGLGRGS